MCSAFLFSAGAWVSAENKKTAEDTDLPVCSKPASFVADIQKVTGSFKNTVRIVDYAKGSGMEFTVYAYVPGEDDWITIGNCTAKGFNDTERMKCSSTAGYRYFAIAAADGTEYQYIVKTDHNDLCFFVYDTNADITKDPLPYLKRDRAYVFDAKKLEGSYSNYIKLDSKTEDKNILFKMYIFDEHTYKWVDYGTGSLKEYGDSDTIDPDKDYDIEDFRYFAIEPASDKDYAYSVFTKHENVIMDNIHIEVRDMQADGSAADSLN